MLSHVRHGMERSAAIDNWQTKSRRVRMAPVSQKGQDYARANRLTFQEQ